MAENSKGGILNSAKKSLIRQKTKVLQSLGKTGKTTDEALSEDCQKLEKQQEVAAKLQKDLRHYINSVRSLSHASRQFYTTLSETYEEEWENHGQVTEVLKNMEVLWEDYLQKLNDQIHEPLTKYLSCIPQIKARIAKRGRKLIDYDNAKHNLEVQNNARKKDEAKTNKAQEDLEHAKKIYEDLNNELHQELPEFYNSRLTFYGNLFENLFNAESVFFTEAGKVWGMAPDCAFLLASPAGGSQLVAEAGAKLAKDNEEHTYTPRKSVRNTIMVGSDENLVNGHSDSGPDSPQPDSPSPTTSEPPANLPNDTSITEVTCSAVVVGFDVEDDKSPQNTTVNDAEAKTEVVVENEKTETIDLEKSKEKPEEAEPKPPEPDAASEPAVKEQKEEEEPKVNGDRTSSSSEPELPDTAPPPVPSSPPPEEDKGDKDTEEDSEQQAEKQDSEATKAVDKNANETSDGEDEGLYQVPPPAKPVDDDYPPKYRYTVIATHDYKGEDDDELSFFKQELIYVVDFENPDEQDPGWLMGMKKSTREMGVFPENFTKPVSEQNKC